MRRRCNEINWDAMIFACRAAAAAMLTVLLTITASASPARVSADVNLRKAPGTGSEILTLIPKGTIIEMGNCSNGWCQVSWNGQEGYAIAPNLGLGKPRKVVRRYVEGGDGYGTGTGYVVVQPYYHGYYPYSGPYWGPRWRYGGWGPGWHQHW